MPLAEVAAPAIELAENGFPMHDVMLETFATPSPREAMRQWPSTRSVFLPDGEPQALGTRVVQKDLANTLRLLVEAERQAPSREAGIRAARERFYRGDIAEQMVSFVRQQGGWLTLEDLTAFHVTVEAPCHTTYRGHDVYACGP
jgi:gamma-glutamyltranspeptidase/glutathione hydrolase